MAKKMSAVISALSALIQVVPYDTSPRTAFFHDLLQLYIPVGGHIELRAPIGDIPQVLVTAVHETQRGTITLSVGDLRNAVPKKKLQILVIESEDALIRMNTSTTVGFTPLSDSHVVMLLPPGYTSEKILMALSLCWRSSFATCLAAIQPDFNVQGEYNLYYSPLEFSSKERCTSHHAPPSMINRWIYGKGFENAAKVAQEIRDYRGCHMFVAANFVKPYLFRADRRHRLTDLERLDHFDGLDASILRFFEEKYNVTVLVLSREKLRRDARDGARNGEEVEGTVRVAVGGSDVFNAVKSNNADLVAGGFVPTESRFMTMHVTRSYARDVLRWYVRAEEDDSWVRLTMCFSHTVWMFVGVAFCLTAALRLVIAPKHKDANPVTTLWGIMTESRNHPEYSNPSELILGVAWIIYCLHVNSAYRAGLAMSLASGPLYEDITASDLYKSDLKLLMSSAVEIIVRDLVHDHRGPRFYCDSDKESCLSAFRSQKDVAILISSNMMTMEDNQWIRGRRKGWPIVREVPGRVLTYSVQMYMAKGHLLLPALNSIVQKLTDAGISMRYMTRLLSMRRQRRKRRNQIDVPLTLYQLAGAFSLLSSGLVLSLVVALFEAWKGKRCFKRLSTKVGWYFREFKDQWC